MKKVWILAGLTLIAANLTSCTTWMGQSSSPDAGMAYNNPQPRSQTMMQQPEVGTAMNQPGPTQTNPMPSGNNEIAAASFGGMSSADRNRLAHALDAAPGKSTHWTNLSTGITYTVTPIRKVVVNSNHLCREYQTTATRNGQSQNINGTACITDDGSWHTVNNS